MDLELNGKQALVTGGSRGIGRGITLALARAGVRVVACYRNDSEAVESLDHELKELNAEYHLFKADVSKAADVAALLDETSRVTDGSLDLVVHNAGTISHVPFADLTPEQWSDVVDTSLTGAYLVCRHALPLLSAGSSVVYIGSRVATVGIPLRAHYTAAKAGLVGLARSQAKEFGPRGIRVNVIAPGVIETEEAAKLSQEERRAYEKRYGSLIALGRFGLPNDIARAVMFLASDLSAYVTGETINVDGGI
jgi:3-oxoacyl-[acyl-carrier protein] reductase